MNKLTRAIATSAATAGLVVGAAVMTASPASAKAHLGEEVKMYSLNADASGSYYFGCRGTVIFVGGYFATSNFAYACAAYAKRYDDRVDIVDAAGVRHRITDVFLRGDGTGNVDFQNPF